MSEMLTGNDLNRLLMELRGYVSGGTPIPDALTKLAETADSPKVQKVAEHLARETFKGIPLSDAMRYSPYAFPETVLAMVRCGEEAGDLPGMLHGIVEYQSRKERFAADVNNAAVYPVGVTAFVVLVVMFVSYYVVPVYRQGNIPETAAIAKLAVKVFSMAGSVPGLIVLAIIEILLLGLFIQLLRSRSIVNGTLSIPGTRGLTDMADQITLLNFIAKFGRRGVPAGAVYRAAETAMNLEDNRIAVRNMAVASDSGNPAAPFLPSTFPATSAWIFEQSERRGDLPVIAEDLRLNCEERYEVISKRLASFLEPALLIALGVIVALILVGIYLPMFQDSMSRTGNY